MKQNKLKGWSIIWWLFKLFGLPITIPWLIYHFLDIMQQKRRKATLSGKVNRTLSQRCFIKVYCESKTC